MVSYFRGLEDSSLHNFMCEDRGARCISMLTGFRLPDLCAGCPILELSPGKELLVIAGDLSG